MSAPPLPGALTGPARQAALWQRALYRCNSKQRAGATSEGGHQAESAWDAWDAAPAGGPTAVRSQRFRKELLCAVLNRRAKVAAAAAAAGGAATAAIAESLLPAQSPDFTSKDGMFDWDAHVGRMTEKDFKLRYRVTSKAFHDDLLPKLCLGPVGPHR